MSDLAANLVATVPTTERRQYSLDSLAYHLSLTKQHNKLQSLFDNDHWMHMRVTAKNYAYTGFVYDLEIASYLIGVVRVPRMTMYFLNLERTC